MSTKIKHVLLIEDNPGDILLIRKMLAGIGGLQLETASRLSGGVDRVRRPGVDVVLLDLSLPDSHGLDTFQHLQASAQGIPILVLSGLDDERLAIQAVHMGAQDYLIKGQINGPLILRAIQYAVERGRFEQERIQLLKQEQFARAEAEAAQERFAFLAEVSTILVESLDYEATLQTITRLAVPRFSDYCVVYTREDNKTLQQHDAVHDVPALHEALHGLTEHYLQTLDHADSPSAQVLRSGEPVILQDISDSLVEAVALDAEQMASLQTFKPISAIVVPLAARGRMLGVITFALVASERQYQPVDAVLAQELARRAALALDNARLYRESQKLNEELEQRVIKRTAKLQELIERLKNEIAERQRIEETLRKTEALLSNLFESAPDAVLLVDVEGKIVRINDQAEKLFGYERRELLKKAVDILLPDRLQARHAELRMVYHKEMRTRPMGIGLELFAKRKDGSEVPVEIMLSPVKTHEGTYVISAVRDITERKQLQAELAEVHRRLFENIEAERLYLSQELHDGPIQDLYGAAFSLSLLKSELEGDTRIEHVMTSSHIVQQVISSIRAICGELRPPTLAPFGLEKAIRAHAEKIKESQPDLKVNLELMEDGQELPERVRLALFRVYQQAISNIVRHAQASQIHVRFSFDSEEMSLEIEDDGRGFKLPQKWIEFARGGHFGLIGAAERVQSIGGHLDILTTPGKGTFIRVNVPRVKAEEKVENGTTSSIQPNE